MRRSEIAVADWKRWLPGLLLAIAAFGTLAVPYYRALSTPAVGLFHDDGIYAVTAKALAEGKGYRLTNLPGSPPQTKYPPGFPVLLSGVWRLFPNFPANVFWLKAVPLVCGLVWLVLSYLLMRSLDTPPVLSGAICLAVAASPLVVYISTSLLSETLFAALCTASLLLLERGPQRGDVSKRNVAFAAALAGCTVLTRAIGVALPLAIAGWLASRREWRKLGLFTAILGCVLLPWAWWVLQHRGEGYYTVENYTSWHIFAADLLPELGQKLRVLASNALMVFYSPNLLWSLPAVLAPVTILVGLGLFCAGLVRCLRRKLLLPWFAVAYLGLVVCWLWVPLRFILVVIPILFWIALQALPQSWQTTRRPWLALSIILLAGTAAIDTWHRSEAATSSGIYAWLPNSQESWNDVQATARWVRENSTADTVVLSNLDPLFHLYTGRKALRGFSINPYRLFYVGGEQPDAVQAYFSLPTASLSTLPVLIVRTPDSWFSERPGLHAAIDREQLRGVLQEVFRSGNVSVLRPTLPQNGSPAKP